MLLESAGAASIIFPHIGISLGYFPISFSIFGKFTIAFYGLIIAIGMNLAQVQHALRIYGMPVLSKADLRSHIISLGINEGKDIDILDFVISAKNEKPHDAKCPGNKSFWFI